ncbi:MAG TPA: VacJ family lipoprotein [Steroidobacteraceae bacterium]
MRPTNRFRTEAIALALVCVTVVGCASQAPLKRDPRDPFERVNRVTFAFNDKLDKAIAKPVARAYRKVAPHFVQTGISNFMDNINYPITIVNDILQGKLKPALSDVGRFVLNTTVGMGGLFDPATAAGLDKNDEDLGLTFGKWGLHQGPYIVLPIVGPSTVRDALGRVGDEFVTPQNYIQDKWTRYGLDGLHYLDIRARLLDVEGALDNAFDRYAVLRSVYLQRRQYQVTGGTGADESLLDEPPPDPDAPASDATAKPIATDKPATTPPDNDAPAPKPN